MVSIARYRVKESKMKGYIELKTNLKNAEVVSVMDKLFKYFPARYVGRTGGFDEKEETYRYEYDTRCDWFKKVLKNHPLVYEIRDDLYCLCQLHGASLIAQIMGNMSKKDHHDKKGAVKRVSNTINDYLEGKIHQIADRKLSVEELKKIFDVVEKECNS